LDRRRIRTKLENQGIYLTFDALTEFAGNVSGGVKQGATFANQEAFGADIDWQRLAGVPGLSTHVIIVNRSGANDSTLFGDNLLPVQEIYGAGGNVALHLVSAYAQEKLFDGRLDLAAGRMNVQNDFASSPLYCNYMNNVLCGDPKALPGGDIGHSAYPDGVWGGRVRVQPTSDTYIATGVYPASMRSVKASTAMISAPALSSTTHRTAACMFPSRRAMSRCWETQSCPATTRSASATIPRTPTRIFRPR
jgi:porin